MSLDINVYYVKPTETEQVQFTVITLLQQVPLRVTESTPKFSKERNFRIFFSRVTK